MGKWVCMDDELVDLLGGNITQLAGSLGLEARKEAGLGAVI